MFYKLITPRQQSHYLLNLRNVTHINSIGKILSVEFKNQSATGLFTYFNIDPYELNFYYDTEEDCLKEFNNIYRMIEKYNVNLK